VAKVALTIFPADENSEGKALVYLRFTHHGRLKYISLQKSVLVKDWKPARSKFLVAKSPNAARLNLFFSKELSRANKILIDLENDGVPVNFDNFKSRFQPFDNKKFIEYAEIYIKQRLDNESLSQGSANLYNYALRALEELMGDIAIKEFTPASMTKFWKQVKERSSESTANTYCRSLKGIYNEIVATKGIKDQRPFSSVKTSSIAPEKKKDDLSTQEISKLSDLLDAYLTKGKIKKGMMPSYYEELRKYLFMIETGLRISDANDLRFGHLEKFDLEGENYFFIQKKNIKVSHKNLVVPLSLRAVELAMVNINQDKETHIFKHSDTTVLRKRMQRIAKICGINKHLTSHTARHTFSERSRERGMSMDDIAGILGNTRNVTEKYYVSNNKTALLRAIINNWNMRKPTKYSKRTILKLELLRENMIKLREKRGMMPSEVHDKIGIEGISLSQYCKYENGSTQLSMAFVYEFCEIMGVSVGELEKGVF
jgi:integrase